MRTIRGIFRWVFSWRGVVAKERFFVPARARLGGVPLEEARAAGAAMNFEQASAFALSAAPTPG